MFIDLLNETKGFKYQINLKVLLKNYKLDREIEFNPVYFNSVTKLVIKLQIQFMYMFDNWINERSGWIVESIESQYINISTYRPLSESSYVKLPVKLRSQKKGLINIKKEDQKCFLWCHIRHVNPVKIHRERITKEDKKLAKDLDYDGLDFPVQEKDFSKIEKSNNICINVFGYENGPTFLIYFPDQKFENFMDLLLVTDGYKRIMCKLNIHVSQNKKYICRNCLQCFSSKNVLTKLKKDCLSINDAQSVKLEKGIIEFNTFSNR